MTLISYQPLQTIAIHILPVFLPTLPSQNNHYHRLINLYIIHLWAYLYRPRPAANQGNEERDPARQNTIKKRLT